MPEWTTDQRRAIETHDRNLLVSAAAGSGKTAVLAERCAYLVCDAKPPCEADELLVVTFTNAAAEEMRKRISEALTKRAAAAADDPRLQRQPLLLAGAQISTIHTLCSAIIRRNFHRLGLDPDFRLMDDDEAKLLRHDVAEALIDERFDDAEDQAFRRLVDEYASSRPRDLRDRILSLHARLSSLLDPKRWLAERRVRVVEAIELPLHASAIGKDLVKLQVKQCETLAAAADRLAAAIARTGVLPGYAEHVRVIADAIKAWQEHLAKRPFDQAADIIRSTEWPTLPRGYKGEEKERFHKRINALKERIKRFTGGGVFLFTEDELHDGLSKSLWAIDRFTALVNDFDAAYTQAKRAVGSLDFNDLERLAMQLLRDPESGAPTPVALEYRGQFTHVLVDEYQDVNELQDTLIGLIACEDKGNLFCVGDVKQSIYRFRHADPQRFIDRYMRYWNAKKTVGEIIDLNRNFRSRGPLLETLNLVFESLLSKESAEVNYNKLHRLVPGATFPGGDDGLFSGSPIELHVIEKQSPSNSAGDLESEEREAVLTAARIREMLGLAGKPPMRVAERDGSTRDIKASDIAVLLRTMRIKAERFAGILRRADVPVQADSTTGFFASTEIGDVLTTLRLIDSGRSDYDLAAYLRSPLSGLSSPEDAMAQVRLAYPRNVESFFHRAVARCAEKNDAVGLELKSALAQLERWRGIGRERSVAELLWTICDDTSYMPWCSGLPDGEQRVANLLHLHERARQFEEFRRPTLNRFLHFITSLEDESDLGMPAVAGANLDAVRIMSVHKSKGLEFPVVILPDLAKEHNLRDTMGTIVVDDAVGLGLRVVDASREAHYPSMASMVAQHHARRRSLAEELRVLYVAGTRAREHLILIGTCDPDDVQSWDDAYVGHTGPIPGSDVHEGRSMLDWIGPASSIAENRVPGSFIRQIHQASDIEALGKSMLNGSKKSDVLDRLAKMEPLDLPEKTTDRVSKIIERLSRPYAYEALTSVPAVSSVTRLTKDDRIAPAGSTAMREETIAFDRVLRMPVCIAGDVPLSAANVGSATHTVLQRLDLSRACDDADIEAQIKSIVERRFLTEKQAKAVDREAIRWWLSTPLARRLCERAPHVLNELELTYMQPAPNAVDADDNLMIRGRLDAVLIDADEQLIVIDYKTDRVAADTVDARAAFYRPQVEAYRVELAKVARRTVKAAYLVFLTARRVIEVE